jgi:hypothetical protein
MSGDDANAAATSRQQQQAERSSRLGDEPLGRRPIALKRRGRCVILSELQQIVEVDRPVVVEVAGLEKDVAVARSAVVLGEDEQVIEVDGA